MDSSFFTLHLKSSLFTSIGFFTLHSSLFTLHFFFHIFLFLAKTANVSLVFGIKVLSLLHTKI